MYDSIFVIVVYTVWIVGAMIVRRSDRKKRDAEK